MSKNDDGQGYPIFNLQRSLSKPARAYDDLEIGNGTDAQSAANQILQGKITGKDLDKIVESLLIYCRQDTMAIVALAKWLIKSK